MEEKSKNSKSSLMSYLNKESLEHNTYEPFKISIESIGDSLALRICMKTVRDAEILAAILNDSGVNCTNNSIVLFIKGGKEPAEVKKNFSHTLEVMKKEDVISNDSYQDISKKVELTLKALENICSKNPTISR